MNSPRVIKVHTLARRLGCWLCCCAVACALQAAEPERPADPPTVARFRKILVPAGDEEHWPVGRQRYLAVEPAEFDALQRAAAHSQESPARPPAAQLLTAHYTARLEGDALVAGAAKWTFRAPGESTLLELGACGLALGDVHWNAPAQADSSNASGANSGAQNPPGPGSGTAANAPAAAPAVAASSAPAAAGVLGTQPTGQLAALLHGSGDLEFSWSLAGTPESSGGRKFELVVPRCLASNFELELPLDLTPTAEPGVVTAQGAAGDSLRRWRIELGSAERSIVRIAPLEVLAERERLALVRQTLNYDVAMTGIELEAEFELDVHYQPLKRVELVIEPGLQLVAARYGETPLEWTPLPSASGEGDRVVMELPEPVLGEGRRLRISARGELVRGARWKLPAVRPEGFFWQEGRANVRVGAPLVVAQLFPQRCRQTGIATLPAPLAGESLEIQFFDPQAAIEVIIERRAAIIGLSTGIDARLNSSAIAANVICDFKADEGDRLELVAPLKSSWSINSVVSVPSEALADWSIEKSTTGANQLRVRLAEALAPGRPLRLRIAAERLRSPQVADLTADDLAPLEFEQVSSTAEVMSVQAGDGVGLAASNDLYLTRLDPQRLEPRVAVFETPPTGMLFVNDDAAQTLRLRLSDQPPRFAAETRNRVLAEQRGLQETYRLRCQPESTGVAKVVASFLQASSEPLNWTWETPAGEPLTARRLTDEECAREGWNSAGETWEVQLPRPQLQSFTIFATRFRPWQGKLAVNLISLPRATQERAAIELFASPGLELDILNARLQSEAINFASDRDSASARGAFSYDPQFDLAPGSPPPLELALRSTSPASARALVWTSELHSRYGDAGETQHTAIFRIQNNGAREIRVALPPQISVDEVWIDEQRMTRRVEQQSLVVPLPDSPRFVTVAVMAREPARGWMSSEAIVAPLFRLETPAVATDHRWFVQLPPGYAVRRVSPAATLVDATDDSLARRLLGPITGQAPRGKGAATASQRAAFLRWPGSLAAAQQQTSRATAEQFLIRLGEVAAEPVSPSVAPVQLGAALKTAAAATKANVSIDRAALVRAGVQPSAMVQLDGHTGGAERGLSLLAKNGLALICQANAITITSQGWWSAHANQIDAWHPLGWGWLNSGIAPTAADYTNLVPVVQWPAETVRPWKLGSAAYAGEQVLSNRQTFEIHSVAPTEIHAVVSYRPRATFLAWCCGIFSLATFIIVRTSGRSLAIGLLILLALALLLPASVADYASAAWIGGGAGLLWRWIASRAPTAQLPNLRAVAADTRTTAIIRSLLIAICLGTAGALATFAAAADPLRIAPEDDFHVFVPVDEAGKPNGEPYQVPEGLLFRLERAALEAAKAPRGYLLTQARYAGALVREQQGARCHLDQLRVTYRLDVLTAPARIEIPLRREQADVLPGSTRLNGSPVPVEWSNNEQSLVVTVSEPGEHRIELALNVRPFSTDDLRRLELNIPAVADAQLDLDLPEDPPAIEVRGAAAPARLLEQGRRLQAMLGSSNRLLLEWPETPPGGATTSEVEQLIWLSVRPGSVTAELRLKQRLTEPRVLRVSTDPRWRLLSSAAGRVVEPGSRATNSGQQWLEFDAAPNADGAATISATFLLTGTSGVGNLRMPKFEPAAVRVKSRWLAYTIDSALEFVETGAAELSPVAVPEFIAAWGNTDKSPNSAYLVPPNDVQWSLGTRPRETVTIASSQLNIVAGTTQAEVRLEARLNTTAGYVFQHELATPANFAVEKVSVISENTERTARWSRHDPERLILFLSGPITGEHTLVVAGWSPIATEGPTPLPWLQIERLAADSRELVLERRPSTQVQVAELTGLTQLDDAGGQRQPSQGTARFVAHYTVADGATPTGQLDIAPNRPQVRALELTTITRATDGWTATYRCVVEPSRGSVDEFAVEISDEWQPPFRCESPYTFRVLESTAGRRRLLVSPQTSVASRSEFVIQGTLRADNEAGLRTPQIELQGATSTRRLIALPTVVGALRPNWQIRGLKPAQLAAESGIQLPAQSAVYEMPESGDFATLEGIDDSNPLLRVRLADYSLFVRQSGPCNGIAVLDIEPASQLLCPLTLPANCELVRAFVDGAEANMIADQAGTHIRLGPKSIPVRLHLLFRWTPTKKESAGRQVTLAGPSLTKAPVERTVWRIFAEPGNSLTPSEGSPLSVMQRALLRLHSNTVLVDQLDPLGNDSSAPEAARNFRLWATRWRGTRATVERALPTVPEAEAASIRLELAAVEAEQQALAERLGATELLNQVNSETLRTDQPGQFWEDFVAESDPIAIRSFSGPHATLRCTRDNTGWMLLFARWGLGAGCLLSAAVVYRGQPRWTANYSTVHLPWLTLAGTALLVWLLGADRGWWLGMLLLAGLGALFARLKRSQFARSASTEFDTASRIVSKPASSSGSKAPE